MAYRKCSKCKGLNGQFKNIYPSINDALSAIRYIQSENPSVWLVITSVRTETGII